MVKQISDKAAFNTEIAKPTLTVVDFFATWCGPCKMMAPHIDGFAKTYTDVTFLKVDVDEAEDLSQSQGVTAMPTFFLYKAGTKVGELVGANAAKLEELIKKNK